MHQVGDVADFLASFAPLPLAESWDNVGLLVGDRAAQVERIMTCLTITPPVVDEALEEQVDLIVAHHPLPFRPLKRLTADTSEGRMLLRLIGAGAAVYSPHTAFDSAPLGINQRLAAGLELQAIRPLVPSAAASDDASELGAGRYGRLPAPLAIGELAERCKQLLRIDGLHAVGDPRQPVQTVAVACGSAGEFLEPALAAGCDCLVTGETRFHTCLAAEAAGAALLLVGHYASERFALEHLADVLAEPFPKLRIWPSRREQDPLRWL